jgi:hypothetical protein
MDNIIFYESADKPYLFNSGGLWWAGPGSFTINNLTSTTFQQLPSKPAIIVLELPY